MNIRNNIIWIDNTMPESHPDVEVLRSIFKFDYLRGASTSVIIPSNDGENVQVNYEGHYINMPDVPYWNKETLEDLESMIAEATNKASEYKFKVQRTSDAEFDDDRSWDSMFVFLAIKKTK